MLVRRRRIVALAALALALPLSACRTVKNPATGETFLTTLSRQDEIQLGKEAAPSLAQEFGGAVPNQQLQQYVTSLGMKLKAQTEDDYPSLPWEFTLLNSPVINAFSLPGGKVFITRGLAEKLNNEAQMAGVLGHEIGHVTAQHVAQQLTHQQVLNAGLTIAGAAVGAAGEGTQVAQYGQYALPALQLGSQLYMLKFSRTDENQADYLGMRYMTKAGYDPGAQLQVMKILKEASGPSGSPEFLLTHPLPESRIQTIEHLLQTPEFSFAVNNPKYGLYPQQYQQQFLSTLKTLPPPPPQQSQPQPQPQQQGQGGQSGTTTNLQNQRISRPRR